MSLFSSKRKSVKEEGTSQRSIGSRIYHFFRPSGKKVLVLNIILLSIIGYFGWWAFNERPSMISQYPAEGQAWTDPTQPLIITFDKPVRKDKLSFTIWPEMEGRLEWVPAFPELPFLRVSRQLRYYPKQSLPTDQPIITYLVGMQSLLGGGGVHEGALEFTPPPIPEIKETSIQDKQKDVIPDQDFVITFTSPTKQSADWQFTLTPTVEYSLEKTSVTEWKLHWKEPLKQGANYSLQIDRATKIVRLSDGETLAEDEFKPIRTIAFTTAKAAAIKGIAPEGDGVLPSETIRISFEEPMNRQSVEQNFRLEPTTQGTFTWKNDTYVTFTPAAPLQKESTYTINLARATRNQSGGIFSKDIKVTFKTIGAVRVRSFTPKNGSRTVQVNTRVYVEFDQPVDKKSAQSKFSLSPSASGSFSWNKNTMVFRPSSYLGYSRTYTAKVSSGVKTIHGNDSKTSFEASFTTAPQVVILNAPAYRQEETFTCNVAAARIALGYYGVYLSENTIQNGVGIGPSLNGSNGGDPYSDWINYYGVYWGPISSFISRYRSNSIKTGWNLSGLTGEISKGHPVIIWWHNGASQWYWKDWTTPSGKNIHGLNGMHSEVVIGFHGPASNPTHIVTQDPWRGRRTYTASYFDNQWRSTFNRTGVVVY